MLIYLYSSDTKSQDEFKGNVISNFTIRLPESIYLNGEWEIALLEAHIPLSWPRNYQFSQYFYSYRLQFWEKKEDITLHSRSKMHTIRLTDGIDRISSVECLMGVLNRRNLGIQFGRDEDNLIMISFNPMHFADAIQAVTKNGSQAQETSKR